MHSNCAETHVGGGVLSAFVFPVDCHCSSIIVVTSHMYAHVRNNNDATKCYSVYVREQVRS